MNIKIIHNTIYVYGFTGNIIYNSFSNKSKYSIITLIDVKNLLFNYIKTKQTVMSYIFDIVENDITEINKAIENYKEDE